MKSKKVSYCLIALCMYALVSCGPDNVDYANKVIGKYNVKITPSISLKFYGGTIPVDGELVETTCTIVKDGENGDVRIDIEGVNGVIDDIDMNAFCSGLGMDIEDCDYDDNMTLGGVGRMECDMIFNNPNTTISNARVFNWNTTVTGSCEIEYTGLQITCDVTGTLNFYLTPIK